MKKQIYILLIILLSLISFASATVSKVGLAAYWGMADTTDSHNDFDLTEAGSITHTTGIIGNGYLCAAGGKSVSNSNVPIMNGSDYTINSWWKYASWSNGMMHMFFRKHSAPAYARPLNIFYEDLGTDQMQWYSGTSTSETKLTLMTANIDTNWHMYSFVRIGTRYNFYKDAVLIYNNTNGQTVTDVVGQPFTICPDANAVVDEVSVWDSALYPADITELYNGGAGLAYPFGTTITPQPSLILSTNLVNNTKNQPLNNITVTYNGTFDSATNLTVNCNIWDSSTLLNTSININISATQNWPYSFGSVARDYYFRINCSNSEVNASVGLYKYSIDTIKPNITTDFINNTNYYLLDDIIFNVNFSDTNLFAYNITFKSPLGIITENYFATNLTGLTSAYNTSTRVALALGYNYSILAETWDSHTLEAIANYDIAKTIDGVVINKDIKIYGDTIQSFDLTKSTDRYSFDIVFAKPTDEKVIQKTIYLDSPTFQYLPNSKYKLHFVSLPLNKWIDFENSNIENYKVSKDEKGIYIITFDTKETSLKFNSIGDLNYMSQKYYYNVISAPSSGTVDMNTTNALLLELINQQKETNRGIEMIPSIEEILFIIQFLICTLIFIAKFYNVLNGGQAWDKKDDTRNLWIVLIMFVVYLFLSVLGFSLWLLDVTNQTLQVLTDFQWITGVLVLILTIVECIQFANNHTSKLGSRMGTGRE